VLTQLHELIGQPLLRVDLEQFKAKLMECPWVASAELWRVLPSTVGVRVVERTPLAIARFSGELFLVDGAGVILDRFGPRYRDLDLPIVDGLGSTAAVGGTVDVARAQLVGQLLHDLAPRPDLLERLSQVDVSNARNAIVTLRGEAARLYLGDEEFLQRLELWSQTVPSAREHLEIDDHFDLRYGPVVYGK
jgi:cell division septal protein FtsQ